MKPRSSSRIPVIASVAMAAAASACGGSIAPPGASSTPAAASDQSSGSSSIRGLPGGSVPAALRATQIPGAFVGISQGVSIALRPVRPVDNSVLTSAADIIKERCVSLGVPTQIQLIGGNIVVELPGVKDTQRAEQLIGQTAQLTFREVEQTLPPTGTPPTTPADQISATGTVVLAQRDQSTNQVTQRYQLGPVLLNGTIIQSATAQLSSTGQWQVNFTTTTSGSDDFDAMAAQEYQKAVAIVLDNNVVSAPVFQAQRFGGQGQITGTFTQLQAQNLALVLDHGSLPVRLEQRSVQTFSTAWSGPGLRQGEVLTNAGISFDLPVLASTSNDSVQRVRAILGRYGVSDSIIATLASPHGETLDVSVIGLDPSRESSLATELAGTFKVDTTEVSVSSFSFV